MRRTVLLLAVAIFLAGCGGSARPERAAPPGLPRHLAGVWASRADAIAVAAESGDGCGARALARSLDSDIHLKIARIPARLRAPLLGAVQTLAGSIVCTPPSTGPPKPKGPPPTKGPKPPKGHGHGPHGRHGPGDGGDG